MPTFLCTSNEVQEIALFLKGRYDMLIECRLRPEEA